MGTSPALVPLRIPIDIIIGRALVHGGQIRAIGHQDAKPREHREQANCGQASLDRQGDDLPTLT